MIDQLINPLIEIHPASRTDIDQIANWQVAMARETEKMSLDLETVTLGVTHVFDHPDLGFYLIAKINGCSAACTLVLSEWSDWRAGQVLWIHSVYVEPEKRNMGVFRTIYSHLKEKVASEPSLRGLRLYVDKTNETAIKTYQSIGMAADHYQLFEWLK